jgi:RHS repeat-associated protein
LDYDALGRLKGVTRPGNDAPTTITFPATTQVTAQTSNGTEFGWSNTTTDSLGRTIRLRRKMPGGQTVKQAFFFDRQGNTTFESEWVLDSVTSLPGTDFSDFDDFGRPGVITRADGTTTAIDYSDTTSYPDSAWVKSVTIDDVSGAASTTKYTSDAFGNLVTVHEPAPVNADTTYKYNVQDRLIQVTQGGQNRYFTYDAFGFLRSEKFPENGNRDVSYGTYNALGSLLSETQPGSLTISRSYDAAGRLTQVTAGGSTYLTNCYDGLGTCGSTGGTYKTGRLTGRIGYNPSASPAVSFTEALSYSDSAGRLSSRTVTVSNGAIGPLTESWVYDPVGSVLQYLHPRGTGVFSVDTTYDRGFPIAIRANGIPVVVSATYQPSGLLASYVTGNDTGHNVTTTTAPDPNSMARPGRISTSGASSEFDTGLYAYDGAGNIADLGNDHYDYDALSRLTQAIVSGSTQGYTYDRWGNLTGITNTNARSFPVSGSTTTNQLTNATYDVRGNLTIAGSENYTYDSLDRIRRYASTSTDFTYLYDGQGERLVKLPTGSATSSYIWTFRDQGGHISSEYQGPTSSRDNVYLGNLLVASYASCAVNGVPGWTYFASDHLGTPRLITDVSGATVDARKYWPYGEEAMGSPTTTQRLRFATMERDTEGSGMRYYDHARSYEFEFLGRFLSSDRLGGDVGRPQSLNRYTYALSNPTNMTDPLGLQARDEGSEFSGFDPKTGGVIEGRFDSKTNSFDISSPLPQGSASAAETCYCQLNINLEGLAAVVLASQRVGPTVNGLGYGLVGIGAAFAGLNVVGGVTAGGLDLGLGSLPTISLGAPQVAAVSAPLFRLAPRVLDQLQADRLGVLAGRLSPETLQRLVTNPSASRFFDAATGRLNVIQRVEDVWLRVSLSRNAFEVISVGPIRIRNVVNSIANGRFVPLP